MAREGTKERDARRNKEDDLSSLRLKRMITSDIRVLEPRVYTEEYSANQFCQINSPMKMMEGGT